MKLYLDLIELQLYKYETAPNFIQNLLSDCFMISVYFSVFTSFCSADHHKTKVMQKLVKTQKINKQFDVKFCLN